MWHFITVADVFISYKQEDRDRAGLVAKLLRSLGYSVFFDLNIDVGESWDRRIETELDAAAAVVVLWSPLSRESEWVRNEARVGKSNGILCPAVITDTRIPLEFNSIQAANLRNWSGEADDPEWQRLAARIKSCVEQRPSYPTPDWPVGALKAPHSTMEYTEVAELLAKADGKMDRHAAYFTILLAAMLSESEVYPEEESEVRSLAYQSQTLRKLTPSDLAALEHRGQVALRTNFVGTLAEACKSLPVEMAETAFANAAGIIMAGGRVLARNVTFLENLYKLLGVAQERAMVILDVSRIKVLY